MSKLTQAIALTVLALWGLASMHCKLEVVPGLEFLRSCCFDVPSAACSHNCESDGCNVVENGSYRAEEQKASAPQPVFILAPISPALESPLPELAGVSYSESEAPPELSRYWRFSYRAALSPRAPSILS